MRVAILAMALMLAACATASPSAEAQTEPGLDAEALLSGGRAPDSELPALIERASHYPLGSEQNPVRVNMPAGERAYLARLRCPNDSAPRFERLGSSAGTAFGSYVDAYVVRCAGAEPRESTVWMDMYHPQHDETAAPPGFTLAPR